MFTFKHMLVHFAFAAWLVSCGYETALNPQKEAFDRAAGETETEEPISSVGVKAACDFLESKPGQGNLETMAIGCKLNQLAGGDFAGAFEKLKVVGLFEDGETKTLKSSNKVKDKYDFIFDVSILDFSKLAEVIVTLLVNGQRAFFVVDLKFSGKLSALAFVDGSLHDFGSVGVNRSLSHEITILHVGEGEAKITGVAGLSGAFSYKGGQYPGVGGTCGSVVKAHCKIVVQFLPTTVTSFNESGLSEQVAISYDNGAQEKTINLDLTGHGNFDSNAVVGQDDFLQAVSHSAALASQGFSSPQGMASCTFNSTEHTFVVDKGNNRVLVWKDGNDQLAWPPDAVLGQNDLNGYLANRGNAGPSAGSLKNPTAVACDGSKIAVADAGNYRVLLWNTAGLTASITGEDADFVLGQTLFTNNSNPVTADYSSIHVASGVALSGNTLIVTDSLVHRALLWTSAVTTNNQAADYVLGQADETTMAQPASASNSNLSRPAAVFTDGTKIAVADAGAHRILIWNSIPAADGAAASLVLGQADFTSKQANAQGIAANTLSNPSAVFFTSTVLYVADSDNHRLLIWNGFPTSNGESADYAIGQSSFRNAYANAGKAVSGFGLNLPQGMVLTTSDELWIADSGNHRLLKFNLP